MTFHVLPSEVLNGDIDDFFFDMECVKVINESKESETDFGLKKKQRVLNDRNESASKLDRLKMEKIEELKRLRERSI